MEAAYKRDIRSAGREFDFLFPKSKGTDTTIISKNATVDDTLDLILDVIATTLGDTKQAAAALLDDTLEKTLRRDWNFVYHNIQYTKDKESVEEVRRPSRAWKDRVHGVDCDCYTVFLSSVLENQGINHALRVTKYHGNPNYSHIYIVVPKNGNVNQLDLKKHRRNYYVLDCVPDKFDFEAPGITEYMDVKRVINKKSMSGLGAIREETVVPLEVYSMPPSLERKYPGTENTNDGNAASIAPVSTQAAIPVTTSEATADAPLKTQKNNGWGYFLLGGVFGTIIGLTAASLIAEK